MRSTGCGQIQSADGLSVTVKGTHERISFRADGCPWTIVQIDVLCKLGFESCNFSISSVDHCSKGEELTSVGDLINTIDKLRLLIMCRICTAEAVFIVSFASRFVTYAGDQFTVKARKRMFFTTDCEGIQLPHSIRIIFVQKQHCLAIGKFLLIQSSDFLCKLHRCIFAIRKYCIGGRAFLIVKTG